MTDTCVWIRTDPDPDGTYRPTLEIDDDTALILTRETAATYASEILRAVAIGEHEAAIYAQLIKVSDGDQAHVGMVIADLREDRPALDTDTPLRLIPGISAINGRAFYGVEIRGQLVGQWTAEDARKHALTVLEAVHVAELDSAYWRFLRTHVATSDETARTIVGDLANWRSEP